MLDINKKWCFYGICTNVEDTYAKAKKQHFGLMENLHTKSCN